MIVLKERLSRLGKAPLLLLRALTAAAIFLVMYQVRRTAKYTVGAALCGRRLPAGLSV